MFKYRAISFPLLLLLLGLIIYWGKGGPYLFAVVAAAAFGMTICEIAAMVQKIGVRSYGRTVGVIGGIAFFLYLLMNALVADRLVPQARWTAHLLVTLALLFGFGVWLKLLFCKIGNRREVIERGIASIGILILIGFPLVFLALIYLNQVRLPYGPAPLNIGARQLLFVILVTKAMDTGGYIFGKLSGMYLPGGNHKICPSISPKKSWEGTVGGILFSVAVSLIFWSVYAEAPFSRLPIQLLGTSFWWYFIAGVVLGIGSLAGDLTESALKRACDVKDSGSIVPGMGGVFDVFDSFIYNGLLFYLLATFLR